MICILHTEAIYSNSRWRDICKGYRDLPTDLFRIEYLEKLPKRQPEKKYITLWIAPHRCDIPMDCRATIEPEEEVFWDIAGASLKQFKLLRSLGWR